MTALTIDDQVLVISPVLAGPTQQPFCGIDALVDRPLGAGGNPFAAALGLLLIISQERKPAPATCDA